MSKIVCALNSIKTLTMVVYISYNIAGRNDLAGLAQLLVEFKPDYVFMQEVTVSRERLEANLGRFYNCQVNTDPENLDQPGTAVAWRANIAVEVVPVVTCRLQRLRSVHGTFINVYAHTGTRGEAARRILFGQDLMGMIAEEKDAVLTGDWNCIIRKEDEEFQPRYSRKISPDLKQLVRDARYVDLYCKFNPGKVHFTWKRQGVNKSRLDRVYYPESKVGEVVKFDYVTHSSDHDASVWVTRGEVQRVKESKTKSYWKLNAAVLSEVNFDVNFQEVYSKIKSLKGHFEDVVDWFDVAKSQLKSFLMYFSKERARTRRDTVRFMSAMLQRAMEKNDWETVAACRAKLKSMSDEDSMGLVIRSRHGGLLETEKASIYHLNRQMKEGRRGRLDKLSKLVKDENGEDSKIILEDRSEVEEEAVGFFKNLFQGYHRRGGKPGPTPFEPDLSKQSLDPFLEGLGTLSQQEAEEILKEISEGG